MQCTHEKNGERCKAHAMRGADFCYYHNPAISQKQKKADSKRGGYNRRVIVKTPMPAIEVHTTHDVKTLLSDTINRVRRGSLDVRIANCIGVLSGHLIKAIEVSTMEDRLEKVERFVYEKKEYA